MRVDPDSAATRRIIKIDTTRRCLKIVGRVLSIDAAFDCVQPRDRMGYMWRERLTGRNTNLFLYEIAAIDFLGDGMFHLDAGVHFHKIKMPVLIH